MTADGCAQPLWRHPVLRAVAGQTLRPGGLDFTDQAVHLAHIPGDSRVLDLGCGTGATVEHLRSHHALAAVGVDLAIPQGAKKGLPFAQADAQSLPFRDASLGAVICECVLSLLPDQRAALHECRRVLMPGGRLILADLYHRSISTTACTATTTAHSAAKSCVTHALNIDTLRRDLADAGMRVVLLEDHTRLLAELAARMILVGASDILPECPSKRPGYLLLIAVTDGIPTEAHHDDG
ncbi:SAM-dependent methyltransferase [Desulfobaculum xiamenense]|uniref:SAM-dependent methyltransferase n=1 Tax=Desulfobaculum xiamenense TaxID=995050 RepID=A0A846QMI5_9BACT|nr:class I SAM-dependent methyltransferase [Desulfobaculum xiamenense]NJB66464.1 SAM-dependent methyltransferase [Desulfobaculum xiamenense]